MPNLKFDEMLLENAPFFAELPDGEYGKGIIFSGNAKYEPLKQFISQHNPRHLRVVVEDNSVMGLVQKKDPSQIAKEQDASKSEVALEKEVKDNDAVQPSVEYKKGPGGRLFPVKQS